MNRKWLIIFIIILLSSCRGAPEEPSVEIMTVTPTSTLVLDVKELAQRTYTATVAPTETNTPQPSLTPTFAPETVSVEEADIAAEELPTATPTSDQPEIAAPAVLVDSLISRYFALQPGTPVGMPNWVHVNAGCEWLGVAGQVFDLDGNPILNVLIEAGGTLGEQPVIGLGLTGMVEYYGPGGYEIKLADQTIATTNQVWVQVKDEDGNALSFPTYFDTYDDCDQNLILVNFVESEDVPPISEVYLPFIAHQGVDTP